MQRWNLCSAGICACASYRAAPRERGLHDFVQVRDDAFVRVHQGRFPVPPRRLAVVLQLRRSWGEGGGRIRRNLLPGLRCCVTALVHIDVVVPFDAVLFAPPSPFSSETAGQQSCPARMSSQRVHCSTSSGRTESRISAHRSIGRAAPLYAAEREEKCFRASKPSEDISSFKAPSALRGGTLHPFEEEEMEGEVTQPRAVHAKQRARSG